MKVQLLHLAVSGVALLLGACTVSITTGGHRGSVPAAYTGNSGAAVHQSSATQSHKRQYGTQEKRNICTLIGKIGFDAANMQQHGKNRDKVRVAMRRHWMDAEDPDVRAQIGTWIDQMLAAAYGGNLPRAADTKQAQTVAKAFQDRVFQKCMSE